MGVNYEHELSNGWGKWENLVLSALKELKDEQKATSDKVDSIDRRVLVIETNLKASDIVAEHNDTDARAKTLSWQWAATLAVSVIASCSALALVIFTVVAS